MTMQASPYLFDADTQAIPDGDGRWRAEIGPGWGTLAGQPNGGYLLATALAATAPALGTADLLTATGHYLRPSIVGPAELDVEVVKRGRLTSTTSTSLSQDGKERLRVLASFGDLAALPGPTAFTLEPPAIPGPDECASPFGIGNAAVPPIADRFDYRLTPGSRWIRGEHSAEARTDGWIRFADGRQPDVAAIPLLVDAFPPAIFEVLDGVVAPTVELTVHIRQRPVDGWIQARLRTRAVLGGIIEEDVELWDSAGRLVAMSRQLAVLMPVG
jgi:acyl-CoA thioesterase